MATPTCPQCGSERVWKGKILEFAWWMKKHGYSEATIERRTRLLITLVNRGANILNPESVKDAIAKQDGWSLRTKAHAVDVYTCFLKMLGRKWEPPRYKPVKKLPFIPLEEELDALISGCNKKTAAFLQLLKETGMRAGETWRLEWIDVDFENRLVKDTPEKCGLRLVTRCSTAHYVTLQGASGGRGQE